MKSGPPNWLQTRNVGSLQTLWSGDHFKLDRLTFVKCFVPLGLDGREVHKNVFAGLALDESKPFAGVEPLYSTLFFHGIPLLY